MLREERNAFTNKKDNVISSLQQKVVDVRLELELVVETKNKELEKCHSKIARLDDEIDLIIQ